MANCITCGQPHGGTKFEECLSCQELEAGLRTDGTGTTAQSGGGFGARPGLIIAGVGLCLVVLPFVFLALLSPTGSITSELGWSAVAGAMVGQFLIFAGLILAAIGGIAKGIHDSKNTRAN